MRKKVATLQIGNKAESRAIIFLEQKEYHFLARNYRYQKGEIDLIMKKNEVLVFVEVRFRSSGQFGFPEQTISTHKKKLLLRTAEQYMFEQNWQGSTRFDVVAILSNEIEHFEDAIY